MTATCPNELFNYCGRVFSPYNGPLSDYANYSAIGYMENGRAYLFMSTDGFFINNDGYLDIESGYCYSFEWTWDRWESHETLEPGQINFPSANLLWSNTDISSANGIFMHGTEPTKEIPYGKVLYGLTETTPIPSEILTQFPNVVLSREHDTDTHENILTLVGFPEGKELYMYVEGPHSDCDQYIVSQYDFVNEQWVILDTVSGNFNDYFGRLLYASFDIVFHPSIIGATVVYQNSCFKNTASGLWYGDRWLPTLPDEIASYPYIGIIE